ncbi:PREDICTED: uncharacterized protein LOC109213958 [Nicotiana attenuata]|uniref:uncharacterized protein LOC109213958 n=1 Tax=Nicotiana attenuata TaxID=49451 RepID=UPI000905C5B9|nr:PREDICTED: uncharacterized protein LOC109213958 [Nicotiana attenuata]
MREGKVFLLLQMVSLLAWNVRGINAPNKQKEVKLLCNEHNIGIVGLLETKVKASRCERRGLWEYLESQRVVCNSPWMVVGDFNSVLHMEDRIGGNPVSMPEVVDFITCVENCGLIELSQHGSRYTWNDKQGEQRVFSKIDWVFVNSEWIDNMPPYIATFLPEGINDHCPVKISLLDAPPKAKKAFQFCNVWVNYPQFIERVKSIWGTHIDGCRMLQIVRKLKLLKSLMELMELNGKHFRNIISEANDNREALIQVQQALQANPIDQQLQQEEKMKYLEFRRTSYLAEMFLQQKSKANWLRLGDDNTKYFFAVIKHRKLQHAITQLQDNQNVLQTDSIAIANIFVNYYEDLLGTREVSRCKANKRILKNGPTLSVAH